MVEINLVRATKGRVDVAVRSEDGPTRLVTSTRKNVLPLPMLGQLYAPHPDDADLFAPDPELDEPMDIDVDAYLHWLETGEGEDPSLKGG